MILIHLEVKKTFLEQDLAFKRHILSEFLNFIVQCHIIANSLKKSFKNGKCHIRMEERRASAEKVSYVI